MFHEHQIRFLLEDTENRLRGSLPKLRSRLLRHRNPNEALWELLTLHASTFLGKVKHERADSYPDIELYTKGHPILALEASLVTPNSAADEELVLSLLFQIRRELKSAGIPAVQELRLEIREVTQGVKTKPPPQNTWKRLFRTEQWRRIAEDCLIESFPVHWDLKDSNLTAIIDGRAVGEKGWSTCSIPNQPTKPQEHSIYRSIKSKADQAKSWVRKKNLSGPLILVIGAHEGLSHIRSCGGNTVSLRQALYSAILDERKMSFLERINTCGTWPCKPGKEPIEEIPEWMRAGQRQRVSGAELVSAVLVTEIKHDHSGWPSEFKLSAQSELYVNWHAKNPINQATVELLRRLNLNQFEFVRGIENWKLDPEVGETHVQRRLRHEGGSIVKHRRGSKSSAIELPAYIVLRVLAGEITSEEAWSSFSGDTLNDLKRVIANGQEIESAEYVDVDPTKIERPRIRLKFSEPKPVVIRVPKPANQLT